MAADQLKQRLQDSATKLQNIVSSLSSISPISLHSDCQDKIREFELMANQLDTTRDLIEPREHARYLLQQLLLVTDVNTNIIDYCGTTIPFSNARLLLFQSYLSITWAVCDSITTAISPLICNKASSLDHSKPPNLVTHFVKEDSNIAYYSNLFLNRNYGWPVCVSYVIRNHFLHDGALSNGNDFFAGKRVVDRYDISNKGWDFLNNQMRNKYNKILNTYHRLDNSYVWPWHRNDLLKLLELCNQEIDEALIFLVGSVDMVALQVDNLLGRDRI